MMQQACGKGTVASAALPRAGPAVSGRNGTIWAGTGIAGPPAVSGRAAEPLVYIIGDQRDWADELSDVVGRYDFRIRTGYD